MIRDWNYNQRTIPYEKINKIEYCYPSGIEGGWMNFMGDQVGKIRFSFSKKSRDSIERAISYINHNAPDIVTIAKTPKDYKIYYRKWFILISTIVCAPVGIFLLWKSPLQRKFFQCSLTAFAIAVIACNLFFLYPKTLDTHNLPIEETFNTLPSSEDNNVETEPSRTSFSDTLTAGHYTVGVDIPSGTYKFFAKSGLGNLMSQSLAVNEILDSGTTAGNIISSATTDELSNILLLDGDILTITGTLEVSAGCDNAGELTPRDQSLNEVELEYGIYTAGDDFPAGTYDLVWIEGTGNVQTDPYDINLGINEIFGEKLGNEGSYTDTLNQSLYDEDGENYFDFSEEYNEINEVTFITGFKNVTFSEGDLLKINDIKIKLIPSS